MLSAPTRQASAAFQNPRPIRVRLRAWGATARDVDRAIAQAGKSWGTRSWEFAEVERLTGTPCPLVRYDPKALACEADFDWAFIAYRVDQ